MRRSEAKSFGSKSMRPDPRLGQNRLCQGVERKSFHARNNRDYDDACEVWVDLQRNILKSARIHQNTEMYHSGDRWRKRWYFSSLAAETKVKKGVRCWENMVDIGGVRKHHQRFDKSVMYFIRVQLSNKNYTATWTYAKGYREEKRRRASMGNGADRGWQILAGNRR